MFYIWSFFRRIFHRAAAPRTSPLVNLPTDCVLMIIEHLPAVDQACLVLTCKSMHYTFNFILDNELFRFPRLYQLLMPQMQLNFGHARRQLLRRLAGDSDSIAYCAKCLKLHRQDHFDLDWSYFSGPPVYKPYCNRSSGVVDLCPCVSMTVLDRRAVVRYLVQTAKNRVAYLNGPLGSAFGEVTTDLGLPGLFHKCELRTSGNNQVFARFQATLYISDDNQLMAATLCTPMQDPRIPYWEFSGLPITMYNIVFAAVNRDLSRLIGPWFFDEEDEEDEQGNVDWTANPRELEAKRSLGYYDEHVGNKLWARQTRTSCGAFERVKRIHTKAAQLHSTIRRFSETGVEHSGPETFAILDVMGGDFSFELP
ncbi:hypothetical protein ASPCAL10884 [Aspergillus calidoustus]|uniref:F-box domain-containing protein n=1 Tax=Aspergillus calidoustus TaxID=454130 RepID=A0A0U5G701_ASPCI|nr:hypothetical protein ASPCAL10884 [Aspergillus calidoustus]